MADPTPTQADIIDKLEATRFLSRNRKSASVGVAFLGFFALLPIAIILFFNNQNDLAVVFAVLSAIALFGGVAAGFFFTLRERSARKKLIGLNNTTPFRTMRIAPFREGVRLGDSVVVTFNANTIAVAYGPGAMYARAVRIAGLVAGLGALIAGLVLAQSPGWMHPAAYWVLAAAGAIAAAWTLFPATIAWEADRATSTLTVERIKWLFAADKVVYDAHDCQTLECYGPLVRMRTTKGKARLLSLGLPDRHNVGGAVGGAAGVAVAAVIKDTRSEEAHQDLCAWRTRRLGGALSIMLNKRLELEVDTSKAGMHDVIRFGRS